MRSSLNQPQCRRAGRQRAQNRLRRSGTVAGLGVAFLRRLVGGTLSAEEDPFAAPTSALCRLDFRTGPWREDVRPDIAGGEREQAGTQEEDLPGYESKVPKSEFGIGRVKAGAV